MARKEPKKYMFSVNITQRENDLLVDYCDNNLVPKTEAARTALGLLFKSGTDQERKIEFRTKFELELLREIIALGYEALKARRREDPKDWKAKSQLTKLRVIKTKMEKLK